MTTPIGASSSACGLTRMAAVNSSMPRSHFSSEAFQTARISRSVSTESIWPHIALSTMQAGLNRNRSDRQAATYSPTRFFAKRKKTSAHSASQAIG